MKRKRLFCCLQQFTILAVGLFICSGTAFGQYTVSGEIQVSPSTTVDSDVNDPKAPYSPNDTIAQNQPIPMPGIAGGYVNNAGAGPVGRSSASGDLVDFYSASLPGGAMITLYIAEDDGAVHDLDLFLVNAQNTGTIVDSSMGTERVESVTAPEDGNYYISVQVAPDATETATNYLLTTSLVANGSARYPLRLGDEFVDGQVIVRFDDKPAMSSFDRAKAQGKSSSDMVSLQARASNVGLLPKAGDPGRNMLMEMPPGVSRFSAMASIKSDAGRAQLEAVLPDDPALRKKLETLWMIKRLRRQPDVVGAEPNYLRRVSAVFPNDPLYRSQWHYTQIDLPQAWDITTGNGETIVAVIDTGVLRDHPDLQGVLPTGQGMGYDFISSTAISTDGDGIDPDWNDTGNGENALFPSSFHGTHTTGTIAAATDNGVGVSGVNWNTKIMPLRALGRGGVGSVYDIQQAVLYAAGLPNDSGTVPTRRADIMNLSLGGTGSSILEQNIYTQARDAGVIIIAAAGNSSSDEPFYPAAYEGVVSVSATSITTNIAYYSNFGPTIDIAAPGGSTITDLNDDGYLDGVLSTLGDDSGVKLKYTYAVYQGTSMAAPHVAGVASLMKAVDPNLTPQNFDALLSLGLMTEDIGEEGRDDQYGYGLINARNAVANASLSPPNVPAELVVDPTAINFASTLVTTNLRASNGGDEPLEITNLSNDSGGWASVRPEQIDESSKLGIFRVTVDRTFLSEGWHTANITFESTANPVTVPIWVQVGGGTGGDAGAHYVTLYDVDTLEAVTEVLSTASVSGYTFTFTDVPAGTYFLRAGSDPNNDSNKCQVGEACGGYPVLNELTPITINADVSGLNFATGYVVLPPESPLMDNVGFLPAIYLLLFGN